VQLLEVAVKLLQFFDRELATGGASGRAVVEQDGGLREGKPGCSAQLDRVHAANRAGTEASSTPNSWRWWHEADLFVVAQRRRGHTRRLSNLTYRHRRLRIQQTTPLDFEFTLTLRLVQMRPTPNSTPLQVDGESTKYLVLRSFRDDGSGVDTVVWFVDAPNTLWFRSRRDSGKVRRIERNPTVELRASNWNGKRLGTDVVLGQATIVAEHDRGIIEERLRRRYGRKWNITPQFSIPGTGTPRSPHGWRERIRRMRPSEPWPDYCVVRVDMAEATGP